jgi:hypothetical protein
MRGLFKVEKNATMIKIIGSKVLQIVLPTSIREL